MVRVEGGSFIMNGGSIMDNMTTTGGAGVFVDTGTFTMNGGTISGNTVRAINEHGGGVHVRGGAFIMNGGTISGNTAVLGGGVFVEANALFVKSGQGGVIYGSNAQDWEANRASNSTGARGHAVFSRTGQGQRNTTARVSQAIDTRQVGMAGGWE
jgi:hypothetical protein